MKLRHIFFVCGLLSVLSVEAQLTLEGAIAKARKNAPAIHLKDISDAEKKFKIKNVNTVWLPKVSLAGQATYQSEVTELPLTLPGVELDFLTKDQYKLTAEVNQTLYDGGTSRKVKSILKTTNEIEHTATEIELEKNRRQVIEIFFSILETDAREQILNLKKSDLDAGIKTVSAAVKNGLALKSEKYELEAAQITLEQNLLELKSVRALQMNVLSELLGESLSPSELLQVPATVDFVEKTNDSKLQYQLLDLQKTALVQNFEKSKSEAIPKAALFVQGGYGKPGLNFLKNEFSDFYIAGVRAKWDLGNFYTRSNDRQIQVLGREKLDVQKDAVAMQTDIEIAQQKAVIEKTKLLMEKDEQLLELRKNIRKTAEVQLENGTITSADFLTKLNDENEVKENMKMREIMLKKTAYLLEHITGNY